MNRIGFIFFCGFWLLAPPVFSQGFPRPYHVRVFIPDSSATGLLLNVSDTAFVLLPEKEYQQYCKGSGYDSSIIPYRFVSHLKVWRDGKFLRSLVIMTFSECALGVLSGLGHNNNGEGLISFSREQAILIGGTAGLLSGIVTGTIVGLLKTDIYINSNKERFEDHILYFRKRSLSALVHR